MKSMLWDPRRAGAALGRATRAMVDHRNPRDAAAISYFSLFALFPALLVIVAVVQEVLGWLEIRRAIVERIIALFPFSREFLSTNLELIREPSTALTLSCVLIVMWTSTWVFSFVENALNRAWNIRRRRSFWQSRMRSITVVCLGGTILLVSACLTAITGDAHIRTMRGIQAYQSDPIIHWITRASLILAGMILATVVFCCIYKLMPDKKVPWSEALSGAAVAAFLWEVGSFIFVSIVPYFDYQIVYGRMGAIVAILAWVYISNLILLFGAQFSAQLHAAGGRSMTSEDPAPASEGEPPPPKVRSFPLHKRP